MILRGATVTAQLEVPFTLQSTSGAPVTGHTFVTGEVLVCPPGSNTFVNVTVSTNVVEKGNGEYVVVLTSTQANTAGKAYVATAVSGTITYLGYEDVVDMTTGAGVNVAQWLGTAAATPTVAGVPKVEVSTIDAGAITATAIASAALTSAKFDNSVNLAVINTGTASAVAASSITIAGGTGTLNYYVGCKVYVVSATTGAGQERIITASTAAASAVCTTDRAWTTTPTGTIVYQLLPANANVSTWDGVTPNALVSGRVDSSTGAMAAGVVTSTAIAASAIGATQIASAALTSAKFDNSVNVQVARTSTATAGAASSITLDASAPTTVDIYKGAYVYVVSGTGAGQTRAISTYSALRVATVSRAWATVPDATSVFQIIPQDDFLQATDLASSQNVATWLGSAPNALQTGRVDSSLGATQTGSIVDAAFAADAIATLGIIREGTAQSGGAGSITLDSFASATNNLYVGCVVQIVSGTGAGQANLITSYTGSSKQALVARTWATNPDSTSVFRIRAFSGQLETATPPAVNVTQWLASAVNPLVAGRVDSSTGAMAAAVITAAAFAAGAISAPAVAAATLTSASFDSSVNLQVARTNTANASTSTTTTLDSGAPTTVDYYKGCYIYIISGTGAGQTRAITSYSASRVCTVNRAWAVTPDFTSVFQIIPQDDFLQGTDLAAGQNVATWLGSAPNALVSGRVDSSTGAMAAAVITDSAFATTAITALGITRRNTAQAGSTSTTIKLDAGATTDLYTNGIVYIVSGTGAGQFRTVSSFVSGTQVATVDHAWVTTPDATSTFAIFAGSPSGSGASAAAVASAVWEEPLASHSTSGTYGVGVPLAAAAATLVVTTLMAFSHDTGLSIKGAFRRMDALAAGAAAGLIGTTAQFFMRDGTTPAITATQNTAVGTRGTAVVTGSEA